MSENSSFFLLSTATLAVAGGLFLVVMNPGDRTVEFEKSRVQQLEVNETGAFERTPSQATEIKPVKKTLSQPEAKAEKQFFPTTKTSGSYRARESGKVYPPFQSGFSGSDSRAASYSKHSQKIRTFKSQLKNLQLRTQIATTSSLHSPNSNDLKVQTTFALTPSYKLNKDFKLSMALSLTRDHERQREVIFNNTKISLAQSSKELNENWNYRMRSSITLPSNVEDREKNSYKGALSANLNIDRKIRLFKRSTTIGYSQSLQKNFHQFKQSAFGSDNTSYSTTPNVYLTQPVTKAITVSGYISFRTGWGYSNTRRSSFGIGQSILVALNDQANLALSYNNAGDALKPNGRDYNTDWFNKNTASVTASLSANF